MRSLERVAIFCRSLYSILASFLMPSGIAFGAVLSWFISVFFVTFPVVFFLEKLKAKRKKSHQDQDQTEMVMPELQTGGERNGV